ncbi:MAG: butyrate kinase [Firmicutes bacterium]|nr:butyrate kinase [Bacillota bacterium]
MKTKTMDILTINPGSTTTKIAVFQDMVPLFTETITHDADELKKMKGIFGQLHFRESLIKQVVAKNNYDIKNLNAVVARGGMIIGLHGGGYKVTPALCKAMKNPENPPHASSMGAQLAFDIAEPLGIPSFIYDSTMGCELSEVAKISGLAEIERYGCCHVLNARAQAMNYAETVGKDYKDLRLLVCHMGGGITVSAHEDAKIIDVSSYDDGPMSPERTGGIPLILWTKLCFSGKYTEEEVEKLIAGRGGLVSYLGTTDCREVEAMIEAGDERAATVYEAMAYQVAKSIAQMSVALRGKVDAVILTGGAAHSKKLPSMIKDYAGHIAPFVLMPGEDELEALAGGATRIMQGLEEGREY